MKSRTRSILGAALAALFIGAGTLLISGDWRSSPSWSEEPFPVEGWFVNLSNRDPCPARVEHDYPDWTVDGCGRSHSFVDGIARLDVAGDVEGSEGYVEDHSDVQVNPNPWFAPMFDDWPSAGTAAGNLMLYPRVLVSGGADVIGVDADGVPVLYVQRNQHELEYVAVFVRDDGTRAFPSPGEVAAALELAGLPDDVLAGSLVATDRVEAIRQRLDS